MDLITELKLNNSKFVNEKNKTHRHNFSEYLPKTTKYTKIKTNFTNTISMFINPEEDEVLNLKYFKPSEINNKNNIQNIFQNTRDKKINKNNFTNSINFANFANTTNYTNKANLTNSTNFENKSDKNTYDHLDTCNLIFFTLILIS